MRNDYVDMASLVAASVRGGASWSGKTVQWKPFAHDEFKSRLDAERIRRFHGGNMVEA